MQTEHSSSTKAQPTTIHLSREELIAAAQREAMNSNATPVVRVRAADGSAEIINGDDPEIQGCIRIPVRKFVADYHTDIDEMRNLARENPDELEEAREIWADAIELRGEILEFMSPMDEPVIVEYQE